MRLSASVAVEDLRVAVTATAAVEAAVGLEPAMPLSAVLRQEQSGRHHWKL